MLQVRLISSAYFTFGITTSLLGEDLTISSILQKLLLVTRFSASDLPLASSFAAVGGALHGEEGEMKCIHK